MTTLDLEGRVFLVTGANTGIGRVAAVELAKRGAEVLLACRSLPRTQGALDEIAALGTGRGTFLPLDLSQLDDVRRCANDLLERGQRIDVLINNAGLAGQRGITADGFEVHFGVNHLGHYLLTRMLMPTLRKQSGARVVHVASRAHYRAPGLDLDAVQQSTPSVAGFSEYAVSKLANVLFSNELARREGTSGVVSHSLHPGVVSTEIWRRIPGFIAWIPRLFMIDANEGAKTTLHCATAADAGTSTGKYWDKCKSRYPSRMATNEEIARTLWDRSAAWVGLPADE